MKSNKRYVANNRQNLQIIVSLPGDQGQTTITFQSGYGMMKEAFYLTDNKIMQEALESDKRFNKSYRLEEIDGMPLIEYNARVELESGSKPAKEPKIVLKDKHFDTVKDAKSWLNTEHQISFAVLKNKETIKEEAIKLGFNIIFSFETPNN